MDGTAERAVDTFLTKLRVLWIVTDDDQNIKNSTTPTQETIYFVFKFKPHSDKIVELNIGGIDNRLFGVDPFRAQSVCHTLISLFFDASSRCRKMASTYAAYSWTDWESPSSRT